MTVRELKEKLPVAGKKPRQSKRADFGQVNRDCALIILQDVDRYGSEESLFVRWARGVIAGHG